MPTNEEIVALLNDLRSAREEFEVQERELKGIGERRGDPVLIDDISRFLEAFDHYQGLAVRALAAVHGRVIEPLPPDAAI